MWTSAENQITRNKVGLKQSGDNGGDLSAGESDAEAVVGAEAERQSGSLTAGVEIAEVPVRGGDVDGDPFAPIDGDAEAVAGPGGDPVHPGKRGCAAEGFVGDSVERPPV
ncbi:hypothetical protein [Actinokineospora inagensis]|uniref:hypothetical protein n=1 Tax=Actinokineospora inagensis TaxID=103730 RepID=UPI00047A03CB|nr:hypothetical protein [Actinokineospora inagensis]